MDIASIRKTMKLTQAQFARQVGTSTAYIGHLETGVRRPSIRLALKIEEIAGVHGLVEAVIADKVRAAA